MNPRARRLASVDRSMLLGVAKAFDRKTLLRLTSRLLEPVDLSGLQYRADADLEPIAEELVEHVDAALVDDAIYRAFRAGAQAAIAEYNAALIAQGLDLPTYQINLLTKEDADGPRD